ncbi:hypothetical protein OROGR_000098 [Orobanche gracilis]
MENIDESSPTKIDGHSVLGFSLTSHDLVCVGSPEISSQRYQESPESSNCETYNISLENGIEGSEIWNSFKGSHSKIQKSYTEASFELIAPQPLLDQENSVEPSTNTICINAGPTRSVEVEGELCFPEDDSGGDAIIRDTEGVSRYQTAHFGSGEVKQSEEVGFTRTPLKGNENCSVGNGEFERLQMENALQKEEISDTKRLLEELKSEIKLKDRECREAWKSLKELQNELMRKSMHVGSLAFAIEGQVKEKSRWFSSLRDLTRKLKILKMDHIKLSEDASMFKQYMTEMQGVVSIVQSTRTSLMDQHNQLHEDIKMKFLQEVKERKELYNKVLELKGNIRVFCRCRPLNTDEIDGGVPMAVDFEAAKDGELTVKSNGISKRAFKFDAVLSPEADQLDVFEETSPLAMSVLDGYNVCIFAYGQTGTGKTFTMEGTDEARGVNYRTLEKLFDIIQEREKMFRYEVSVSVLEVYNEQIRDLLVSDSHPGLSAKRLEIKRVGEGGHHVPGLVEARVNNVSEVWEVLRSGGNLRAVGSTNSNEHSSRSHCMHCVMVKGENLLNGECTRSKLWLVDLAGSERVAKTEVQGERLKETQNINRSLSALGDVISALATRSPHIPFRNSKLTHLLQDSLGGDSKTLMFVQISPNENDLSETICSLNFASRVRGIELGHAKKQIDKAELFKHKQMDEKLRQDLKSKDFQVKKLEDANYGLEVKMKEKDAKNRNLQDKIKELESQLLVERKLARQHVDSRIAQETRHYQDDHISEPVTAPLATKTFTFQKFQPSTIRISSESDEFSFCPPHVNESMDDDNKENNPAMSENLRLPKPITGRASLCPTFHRNTCSSTLAPRRNSLIPMPTSLKAARLTSAFVPLTPIQGDGNGGVGATCFPEHVPCDSSPKDQKNIRSMKTGSASRRSLHKKICMKSPPMQTGVRRVGVNVGMEKVRVSIGSRGRTGQRVLLGGARRGVVKDNNTQMKISQREKERGWNSKRNHIL